MSANFTDSVTAIRSLRLVAAAAALSLTPTVGASVFDVGSTGTAESLEIKAKFYSARSRDKQTWRIPGLSLSGMITNNLEWGIGSGYATLREYDGSTRGGLRDVLVGTKWRFLDHSAQGGVAMAVEPEFTFPTSSKSSGVGNGALGFELPLRVARRFGPVLVIGQARVERTFGRDDDSVGVGVLTEYAVSGHWSYGIEFVADAPRKQIGAYHFRGNVGVTWEPNDRFELQMLAGHSLDNRRDAASTSVRLALEYRL